MEEYFIEKKHLEINLLEIGIFRGESLAIWCDYFTNGKIYGLDGNTIPFKKNLSKLKEKGAFENNFPIVIEGDGTLLKDSKIFKDIKFDFIIDDGCHNLNCILKTFEIYFPLLKNGGVFFVEDNGDAVIKLRELYPNIKNRGHVFIKN